jgi:FMN phosphatase YigB (HAD superfamily)
MAEKHFFCIKLKIMILSDARDNQKNEIKNILFDWGGVITELHLDATKKAFHELGLTIFDDHIPKDPLEKVFIPFEIGRISPEEFRNNIRKLSANPLTDTMIDAAWNAMLGVLPEERWKLLESISQSYRTFLLSNTNAIHVNYYFNYLKGIYGTYGYLHLFEKTYFSHEIHLRKPNADIFEFVLQDAGIEPQETLFIDDFPENIETARKLGFHTVHLTKPKTLTDLFKSNRLLLST